jgi:hypothetical protein
MSPYEPVSTDICIRFARCGVRIERFPGGCGHTRDGLPSGEAPATSTTRIARRTSLTGLGQDVRCS